MDATELIEEAGRWAQHVRQSPGIGTAGEDLYLAGLLDKLAAALKASEEQNGAIRRGLDWERAEREKVAEFARKIGRERDDLAAANLAANKRIEELEHERDAARAEFARLTTPRPIAEAPKDGTWILGVWLDSHASVPTAIRWVVDAWADESQENLKEPTHYLPLPDVKP